MGKVIFKERNLNFYSTVKAFIMLQKISVSKTCCAFERSIHESLTRCGLMFPYRYCSRRHLRLHLHSDRDYCGSGTEQSSVDAAGHSVALRDLQTLDFIHYTCKGTLTRNECLVKIWDFLSVRFYFVIVTFICICVYECVCVCDADAGRSHWSICSFPLVFLTDM